MNLPTFLEIDDEGTSLRTEVVICPLCPPGMQAHTASDFGVCRQRKTGRNLYCKACVRRKVTEGRRAIKSYHQAQRDRASSQQGEQAALPLIGAVPPPERDANGILMGSRIRNPRYPHHERVLGAIHQGARTQAQIMKAISASSRQVAARDALGESLALLLLGNPKAIRVVPYAEPRQYLPAVTTADAESAVRRIA